VKVKASLGRENKRAVIWIYNKLNNITNPSKYTATTCKRPRPSPNGVLASHNPDCAAAEGTAPEGVVPFPAPVPDPPSTLTSPPLSATPPLSVYTKL
jgi:hypothetical protein